MNPVKSPSLILFAAAYVAFAANCAFGAFTPKRPFRVECIDAENGWPVPGVQLTTSAGHRFVSDNAGVVAIGEPDYYGRSMTFSVTGHGYRPSSGASSVTLSVKAGGEAKVELARQYRAMRLGRIGGGGLFGESMKVGERLDEPEDGEVGRDSVQVKPYGDKLFWLWGDTNVRSYPLGVFNTTASYTANPPFSAWVPPVAPKYANFKNSDGNIRGVIDQPWGGLMWIFGLVDLKDKKGNAKLGGAWTCVSGNNANSSGSCNGLCTWNPDTEKFDITRVLNSSTNSCSMFPDGNNMKWTDEKGKKWILFGGPYPWLKIPDSYESWCNPDTWEKLSYSSRAATCKGSTTSTVTPKGGQMMWNAAIGKYVAIFYLDLDFGGLWYAEADSPFGPWYNAEKVCQMDNYNFYNPVVHAESDPTKPYLIFEATYTDAFVGQPDPTARWNYTQVLYRLNLDGTACEAAPARTRNSTYKPPVPFRVKVVDAATGEPMPLVTLTTVDCIRHVSDNAGMIAVDEQELYGYKTWFHVSAPDGEKAQDGFGYRGFLAENPKPASGETYTLKLNRTGIGRCLGRVTGTGTYADSEKLGDSVPSVANANCTDFAEATNDVVYSRKKSKWLKASVENSSQIKLAASDSREGPWSDGVTVVDFPSTTLSDVKVHLVDSYSNELHVFCRYNTRSSFRRARFEGETIAFKVDIDDAAIGLSDKIDYTTGTGLLGSSSGSIKTTETLPGGSAGSLSQAFRNKMTSHSVSADGYPLKLNYRQYVPEDYDASKKYPVLVFLHGLGETDGLVSSNAGQLNYGLAKPYLDNGFYRDFPAIFIVPQCPTNHTWHQGYSASFNGSNGGTGTWGDYTISDVPANSGSFGWQIRLVKKAVEQVMGQYSVDADRIYITGLSMGGFGTWNLITHYPDFFAAAAPLCGAGDSSKASRLVNLPIWCFHGDNDQSININNASTKMYSAITACGGDNMRYTVYQGAGHQIADGTYNRRDFYEWLFEQRRRTPNAPEAEHLVHRYRFDGDTYDDVSGDHCGVMGTSFGANGKGITISAGSHTASYVGLPVRQVPSGTGVATLEFFFTFGAHSDWSKLFYAGNSSTDNLVFTLQNGSGSNGHITVNGNNYTTWSSGNGNFTPGNRYHVAVVVATSGGKSDITVYKRNLSNASDVGVQSVSGAPWTLASGGQTAVYFGRNVWNDNSPGVTVEEFRAWDRAFTAADAAASASAGPDVLPDFTPAEWRFESGVTQAVFGSDIPSTAHLVFAGGAWAPKSASFTGSIGDGPGNVTVEGGGRLRFCAVGTPLTLDFGGRGADVDLGANSLGSEIFLNWDAGDAALTVANRLVNLSYFHSTTGNGKVVLSKGFTCAGDAFFDGGEVEIRGASETTYSVKPTGNARVTFAGSVNQKEWEFALQGRSVSYFPSGSQIEARAFNVGDCQNGESASFAAAHVTGGTVNANGDGHRAASLVIGRNNAATGTLYVTSGKVTSSKSTVIGQDASTSGLLSVSGGTVTASAGIVLAENQSAAGRIELLGGRLETTTIKAGGAGRATSLYFNGGTLAALGTNAEYTDWFAGVSSVEVGPEGLVIDVGSNNVTVPEGVAVVANGPIVKKGGGRLRFSGNVQHPHAIRVDEGSVVFAKTLKLGAASGADGLLVIPSGTSVECLGGIELCGSADASGRVELRGGSLTTTTFKAAAVRRSSSVLLDGGTLVLGNSGGNYPHWLGYLSRLEIAAGGVTLDIGDNNVTIDSELDVTWSGTVVKKGSGKLTVDTLQFGNGLVLEAGNLGYSGPQSGNGALTHRFRFDGDLYDDVTKANASGAGYSYTGDGKSLVLTKGPNGSNFIDFGSGFLPPSGGCTVEIWVKVVERANWSKLFSCGSGWENNLVMTLREDSKANGAITLNSANYSAGTGNRDITAHRYHFALTVAESGAGSVVRWYKHDLDDRSLDGVYVQQFDGWTLANLEQNFACIGKTFWNDDTSSMEIEEFRVWNRALTETDLAEAIAVGPDVLPRTLVSGLDFSPSGDVSVSPSLDRIVTAGNYLLHRWSFNGSYADGVGNATALPTGTGVSLGTSAVTLAGGAAGTSRVALGSGLVDVPADSPVTLEFWATPLASDTGRKLFTLGNDGENELFFGFFTSAGQCGSCIRGGKIENYSGSHLGQCQVGVEYHVSVVLERDAAGRTTRATFRRKNPSTGETLGERVVNSTGYMLSSMQNLFTLGQSLHDEPDAPVSVNEVRVWAAALSDAALTLSAKAGPDAIVPFAAASDYGRVTVPYGSKIAANGDLDLGHVTVMFPDGGEGLDEYLADKGKAGWTIATFSGSVTYSPNTFASAVQHGATVVVSKGKVVLAKLAGYDKWAADNGVGAATETTEGLENIFRYVFDKASGELSEPLVSISFAKSGQVVITTPEPVNLVGVTLKVLASKSLTNWKNAVEYEVTLDNDGKIVVDVDPGSPQMFFRLAVE